MLSNLKSPLRIFNVNHASGAVAAPELLMRAESIHRQLRPQLPSDYSEKMRSVFAGGGRMCVALVGDDVAGVAVYRVYENTFDGLHMYVDDLVTDERMRSAGVGKALLDHLQGLAREARCVNFTLDSGTQRQQAHRFYFREGMLISSFHFKKELIRDV
jgi:GNAT superfamily N-acetyltransferase